MGTATSVKTEPLKVPVLEIQPFPKIPASLPLSPFIGKPIEGEVLGKAKGEESVLVKEDLIVQTQKPVDERKLEEVLSKPYMNFNIPDFTFRSQIPQVQSVSGIYTPSGRINLRIPQIANFLPQQLRTQQTNFGGFSNCGRVGRVLRSSGPFVIVQSPIIPNPSIVYTSSSTESIPNKAQEHELSSQNKPQDSYASKSSMSQSNSTRASQVVDSMVQGIIEFPKEDVVAVEVTSKDIVSNTE